MRLLRLTIPRLTLPRWGALSRPKHPPTELDRLRDYLAQKDALNEFDNPRDRLDRISRVSKL